AVQVRAGRAVDEDALVALQVAATPAGLVETLDGVRDTDDPAATSDVEEQVVTTERRLGANRGGSEVADPAGFEVPLPGRAAGDREPCLTGVEGDVRAVVQLHRRRSAVRHESPARQ